MVDEVKRAIEIAETIPFRYLIQHIGVSGEEFDERKVDAAFSALEELMIFARQRGVEILLENIPNGLSSAERLQHFVGVTHLDLHFVFDTGHANIAGGVESEFEIMKERIRSTHVHDNDGKADKHLFPFLAEGGTVDWKRTMQLLGSRSGQYPLMLELKEVPEWSIPWIASTKSSTAWRTRCERPAHHDRGRRAPCRRNRERAGMALQHAQVRQDRVSPAARRHRPDAVRGGEERAAGSRCSKPSKNSRRNRRSS